MLMNIVYSMIFWISIVILLVFMYPNLKIYKIGIDEAGLKEWGVGLSLLIYLLVVLCLPMNLSPIYGESRGQRQQYEKQAEAFLKGQLYLDIPVDKNLIDMPNPYDPAARDAAGVDFQYDTAFYNEHYYMYFGVVPVFLFFLPILLIFGHAVTGYHVTQFIVVLTVLGIALLLKKLTSIFFPKFTFGIYILLVIVFSSISTWYVVSAPTLYTVPNITSIMLMMYSFLFYVKAIWDDCSDNKSIVWTVIGALLGALAFGGRPTIAFANIMVIPFVIAYFKRRGFSLSLLLKVLLAVIPYLAVGSGLMMYNYLRFDNPFEFGQSYQLTTADQSMYMDMASRFSLKEEIHGLVHYFVISSRNINVLELGAFISFPVLLFIIFGILNKKILLEMIKDGIFLSALFMGVVALIIASIDTIWSPYFWPRYRMDIYWIVCVLAFIVIGYLLKVFDKSKFLKICICVSSSISAAMCFLMCIYPFDHNFAFHYKLTVAEILKSLATFGVLK